MAKLTTQFVKNIKPTKQINVYWDDLLKGFGLCVRPSGKKTFLLKYRIESLPKKSNFYTKM